MYLYKKSKKIIKYKKKEKLSLKMALPPEESLTSKDGTVYCRHTPRYSEHFFGPLTVHYREVSLFRCHCVQT